jgi:hypothetical protein
MNEKWLPIADTCGRYEVSNLGRVRSLDMLVNTNTNRRWAGFRRVKGRILVGTDWGTGYLYVQLCVGGTKRVINIHRLVAIAFIPNPDLLPEVNHKDFNKTNNVVTNLEWCTHRKNMLHAWNGGKMKPLVTGAGDNCAASKLTSIRVAEIKRRLLLGESVISIHKDYPFIDASCIDHIRVGRTWKKVVPAC